MGMSEPVLLPTREAAYDYAREVFGDLSKAHSWMTTPNRFFKGMCPKDVIEHGSTEDIRLVIEELRRIDLGLF